MSAVTPNTPAAPETQPTATDTLIDLSQAAPPSTSQQAPAVGQESGTPTTGTASQTDDPGLIDLNPEADKDKPPANPYIGAPEGDYAEFKIGDGTTEVPLDTAAVDAFKPIAKELGLSQAGAQKLVELYAQINDRIIADHVNNLKALAAQARKDPEYGGAAFDANVGAIRATIGKYGTPGLVEALNVSGVANHPEFLRFVHRIAQATREASLTQGNPAAAVPSKRPAHEVLYGGGQT